jgi:hypothetical protein
MIIKKIYNMFTSIFFRSPANIRTLCYINNDVKTSELNEWIFI